MVSLLEIIKLALRTCVEVFMEHAQEEDLLTLLLRVSQAIRAYSTAKVPVTNSGTHES
jgi:hypothetical protein